MKHLRGIVLTASPNFCFPEVSTGHDGDGYVEDFAGLFLGKWLADGLLSGDAESKIVKGTNNIT